MRESIVWVAGDSQSAGGVSLTELLAALSLGTDLGMGHPTEHVLRQSFLALRLAERLGLRPAEREVVYYSSLLAWVGCHVDAYEQAKWFGDDRAVKHEIRQVDLGKPIENAAFTLRHLGAGGPLLARARLGVAFLAEGRRDVDAMFDNHWRAADTFAERLGLGQAVRDSVGQTFERWDGKGVPAASGRFRLPPAHAACLTGEGVDNLAPLAYLTFVLAKQVPAVSEAFRDGGGVPYAAYLPELHDVMEALWGPVYDTLLVDRIVPLAPGLARKLTAGARAADVACGTGRALMALAEAYPASTFTGIDRDGTAIERARNTAAARKLTNLRFETRDAATLTVTEPLDAVFAFNAIHDQADPATVLRRIHAALVPGGTFLMNEPRLSGDLEDNLANPMAPFVYAVSTLHCLTVSLAEGGAALGTAFGEQTARQMLTAAGFAETAVHDAPGDPGNAVYVTHKRPT